MDFLSLPITQHTFFPLTLAAPWSTQRCQSREKSESDDKVIEEVNKWYKKGIKARF